MGLGQHFLTTVGSQLIQTHWVASSPGHSQILSCSRGEKLPGDEATHWDQRVFDNWINETIVFADYYPFNAQQNFYEYHCFGVQKVTLHCILNA